ncbi:MAG: hypothetical protein PVG86_02310 [Desulfobacterales bacterium]
MGRDLGSEVSGQRSGVTGKSIEQREKRVGSMISQIGPPQALKTTV